MIPAIASRPFKACKCCGRTITRAQWDALPLVHPHWEGLTLRNCTCGSTLAVPSRVPYVAIACGVAGLGVTREGACLAAVLAAIGRACAISMRGAAPC